MTGLYDEHPAASDENIIAPSIKYFFILLWFSLSSSEPLADLGGDNLGATGAAAVAGHDGATLDADRIGLGINDTLQDSETLVAEFLHLGGDGDAVVVVYLHPEVNIVVHHHDGEVALSGREAVAREESILAQVEVLHDDSVVDMTHLVNIIESNLYRCNMHWLLFF